MTAHILDKITKRVQGKKARVIYTEGEDNRVLIAAAEVLRKKIGVPVFVGNRKRIENAMSKLNINSKLFEIVDPVVDSKFEDYVKKLVLIRKKKGMTPKKARELMKESNYFGTMMLEDGRGDCLLSGASYTTAQTLRPGLEIIGTEKGTRLASSFFIMLLDEKPYLFADCAFNRYPTSQDLSDIAISTADSAAKFGLKPRVAMLSYSTKGSGFGESVDTVRKAAALVKKRRKDLTVDGEMQLDAAIVPEVAKLKCPDSVIKGDANVLIFPDLNSGNIGYKLVERLAKAKALGPIVQGLRKELNVLSRGCSIQDIVDVSTITIMRSLEKGKAKHFNTQEHLVKRET